MPAQSPATKISHILCDIDGCLVESKVTPWDLRGFQYLARQHVENFGSENGAKLTLCTGRPQPYAEAVAHALGIYEPIICESGSLIYFPDTGRHIPSAKISADAHRDLAEFKQVLIEKNGALFDYIVELGNEYNTCIAPNFQGDPAGDRYQNMLAELHDFVETLVGESALHIGHSSSAIDITIADIDKFSDMMDFCEIVGSDPNSYIGVGDSNPDIAFLSQLGNPGCPANATQAVKDVCRFVSEKKFLDGTIDVIEKLLSAQAE